MFCIAIDAAQVTHRFGAFQGLAVGLTVGTGMVMALLGHGRTLAPDEADAAGVALCHAFTWRE